MKKTTISDVAKHAQVSKSTVSQYLNERYEYMREETRERIENAIEELNYQPNNVARSLKLKSTATIGVIVANILHSFSTQVIRSIEDTLNENDFSTIICNADDDPEKEKKYIETLLARQVDGLIVFPTSGNRELYKRLIDSNFPIVFVDRYVNGLNGDAVMLDNEKAIHLAVEHLLTNGYENIAVLTTSIDTAVVPRVERVEGYKSAMERFDLPIREGYIKSMDPPFLKKGIDELFQLENPPQAIVSGNDLTLMEFLKYASDHDLEIGRDVGLVTIDEVSFAEVHYPSLTTIAQPTFEMGKKAVELVLHKFESEQYDEPQIYRFDPSIIIRKSAEKAGARI
ncbi:LacI family DNA-binding transcriptional regulator [Salinibacillus xinjiangensis]|uniref:LacI family DNA-binding transcriptional regulator n=1 Tax=Salinibacillus xinjiangensis TaxID=1229268 RepID=A0A6G1X249_9BACI|nr:substrate-binding domain-containing protein [Salinibacillus xinjiangensis]MRG84966.1 LacI family DNA-binding transcriptional regulator [Salinibacillus xinjiangensis]